MIYLFFISFPLTIMYEYVDFVPLTEDEVLKRVSQEEIIEMAIGYKPIPFQWIKSPLRIDPRPGARFQYYGDKLFFIDFGDPKITHRFVFRFISDFYNLNYGDALQLINNHFQLGLGLKETDIQPKPIIYQSIQQQSNARKDKDRVNITYKPRPLTQRDGVVWGPYGITREQLIEDEVYAAIWYRFFSHSRGKWYVIRPDDVCYVYTEWRERVKIYRPASKTQRFTTNCTENDIGSLHILPEKGKNLIITKAYKCCRVLRNEGLSSIWFQNEGCVPSDEILLDLCQRFDNIWVWFDNDEPGIKASFKITAKLNELSEDKALPIWLPEAMLSHHIKDPSDLRKANHKELQSFIKQKGFYAKQ